MATFDENRQGNGYCVTLSQCLSGELFRTLNLKTHNLPEDNINFDLPATQRPPPPSLPGGSFIEKDLVTVAVAFAEICLALPPPHNPSGLLLVSVLPSARIFHAGHPLRGPVRADDLLMRVASLCCSGKRGMVGVASEEHAPMVPLTECASLGFMSLVAGSEGDEGDRLRAVAVCSAGDSS